MEEQVLGIDWGEARIGLALGNSATKLASPIEVVVSIDEIEKIAHKEGVERLVIGRPIKDQEGNVSPLFEEFCEELEKRLRLPISYIDERFSTQAADRLDPEARRRGNQDAIAAMLILQTYFDTL